MQSVTTNGKTISYDYDVLGNKRSMTTPGAKTVLYGYDTLSRLSTVTHYDGAVTTFGYDKVGNRQSVTRQTSTGTVFSTTGYTYDPLNRLTDIVNRDGNNAIVSYYHYLLRADGKRSSVTDASGITNYTYDDQGKLTLEAGPYATIAYTYDNVGNRLTRIVTNAAMSNGTTLGNGVTNTAYDANDRIVGHTYDANGSETTVNGQPAGYDFENHLVSLGSVANYVYDADGNRYSAANAGTTTSYVVDTSLPYASVVEEYSNGSLAARYDYGDDLVRMDRGSGVYYYLYDGLGSTRQLISTAGAVTDSWGYSAFGELASHTGSAVNPFLFNAQQFDGTSGDYYLRARYYDQSAGRFVSQDSFAGRDKDPISLHRYLYANNDPVDYIDPTGKDSLVETIVAFAVVNIIRYSTLITVGRVGLAALTLYGIATNSESCGQFYALSSGLPGGPGSALAGLVGEASGITRLFSLTEDIVSGTVAQNFLNDAEYAQAQQVAEFRGGHFEGQPIENLPGFDGYINGEPASLKYIENSNPLGILQNVGKNDQALSKPENMKFLTENGYLKPGEQVEVFVFAPNVSSEKLADFASKGPLGQIPGRGRISGITVKTADGWLRISTH